MSAACGGGAAQDRTPDRIVCVCVCADRTHACMCVRTEKDGDVPVTQRPGSARSAARLRRRSCAARTASEGETLSRHRLRRAFVDKHNGRWRARRLCLCLRRRGLRARRRTARVGVVCETQRRRRLLHRADCDGTEGLSRTTCGGRESISSQRLGWVW